MSQVCAEIAGQVLELPVAVGDRVDVGETVALMESMKMEIPVQAEIAGVVTAVCVRSGDAVSAGSVLVEVQP